MRKKGWKVERFGNVAVPPTVTAPKVAPPTAFKTPATVVDAETAKEPLEVALEAVSPPLKAICVEVAFEGKRYPIVLVITPVTEL